MERKRLCRMVLTRSRTPVVLQGRRVLMVVVRLFRLSRLTARRSLWKVILGLWVRFLVWRLRSRLFIRWILIGRLIGRGRRSRRRRLGTPMVCLARLRSILVPMLIRLTRRRFGRILFLTFGLRFPLRVIRRRPSRRRLRVVMFALIRRTSLLVVRISWFGIILRILLPLIIVRM